MICTSVSNYDIIGNVLWCAELSDGTTAYRNDSDDQVDSWLRLKEYLAENPGLIITRFYFRFRDNYVGIEADKSAWFFTKAVSGWQGSSIAQHHFYGGYAIDENQILIKKFITPELVLQEEEIRDINDPTIQRGLIINGGT